MAKLFQITRPDGMSTVKLDIQGHATVQYTVKNVSARTIDGRALLLSISQTKPPDGPVEKGWVKLEGNPERHFDINKEETFTVKIAIPPNSPVGNYTFRLDVVSVAKPDEGDQGQTVAFAVTELTHPPPLKWWIPITAGVVLVAIISGVTWLLIYRKVEVPQVKDKQITEAKKILENAGLGFRESTEPIIGISVGQVLKQDPEAGKELRKGEKVALIVARAYEPIDVPKVIGDKLDNAKKKLDESHLLYTVTSKIDPGAVQEQITDQVPKEGKVMPGDTIALTIAVPPEPITLKNYIGKQIGIAQGELESMGLKVSLAQRIDPQIQQGQVVDQAPKEGTKVKPGDTITLIGSVTLVPVPALNGANWRLLVKDFNARFGLNIDLVQGSNCNAPVGDQSLKPPLFVPKETSMTLTLQGGGTAVCYRRPGRSIFLRDFLNSPAAEIQKIPRIP